MASEHATHQSFINGWSLWYSLNHKRALGAQNPQDQVSIIIFHEFDDLAILHFPEMAVAIVVVFPFFW